MINIQGKEHYLGDFMKNTFNFGFCLDDCEPISFELGVMLDTTRLCSLIPFELP